VLQLFDAFSMTATEMATNGAVKSKRELIYDAIKDYNNQQGVNKTFKVNAEEREAIKNIFMCDNDFRTSLKACYQNHKAAMSGQFVSRSLCWCI
jgi:hypothetical protein